ncbi:hypothetical protein [Rhodococcus wratislaviensis]|uniref:hypothetical protein n=1 Tax=Rhodococcus wratislaviensis TaxID=44752 RepID=UPI00365179CC
MAAVAQVEHAFDPANRDVVPEMRPRPGSARARVEQAVAAAEAQYAASEEREQTREEAIAEVHAERVAEMDAEREGRTGRMFEELAQAEREKRLNPPAYANPKTMDIFGESTRSTGVPMGANDPEWSIEQQIARD